MRYASFFKLLKPNHTLMKKVLFPFVLLMSISLLFSCSKEAEVISDVNNGEINTILKEDTTIHQYVYSIMAEKGWSQCSYFVHEELSLLKNGATFIPSGPQGFVLTEGEFPMFTAFGGFSAIGGPGDWIRINPDGSATLQINSNDASAEYNDFSNPVFPKTYTGTGHMHMHHTGELIQIPLPGGIFLYTVQPGGHGAVVWHGKADVVQVGTTAPEYKFTAKYVVAGNGKVVKNLLKLK